MNKVLNNPATRTRSPDQRTQRASKLFPALGGYVIPVSLVVLMILAAVVGIWPLAVPPPLPATTAPDAFSVEEALADLAVITAQPRAPGMPGLAASREYLAGEFTALGLTPEITDEQMVEQNGEFGIVTIAQAYNLLARLPGTDSTGAIVIAGHLDGVHTTPGASDCGGCAVGVLEVARALVAGPPLRNDIIFLIEDGEETTRAGSLSFVERHPWAQDVRVAINQEAMGTAGASLLYVTGPENGLLVPEALSAMPAAVAYSFVNDLVWLSGTGGSDLDQLLMAAPVGLGLVYVGNVPAYHSAQDNIDNLDPRTLQHQGENVLALARHFGNLPLDGSLTAPDAVYFTLINGLTVRYPAWVGMLLALLAVGGYILLVIVGLRRQRVRARGLIMGALLLMPLVLAAMALSAALWYALRLIDPRLQVFLIGVSYDQPWYTLAFALLTSGLVVAGFALFKRQRWTDLGVGVLAWWVLLTVLSAWRVPGSSPIFVLPALLALLPLAWIILGQESASRGVYIALLGLAGAGSMLIVAPAINFLGIFSGRAELIMGLPMMALLPAPFAGLLAALFLPLWEVVSRSRRVVIPVALTSTALAILVGVGLTASFTPTRPKPNMIAYVMEEGQAQWVTVAGSVGNGDALLDRWTEQFFPAAPQEATFNPWGAFYMGSDFEYPAYGGPAPVANLVAPTLQVVEETITADGLRQVQARITVDQPAPMQVLRLEAEGGFAGVQILGKPLAEVASAAQPAQVLWVELYGIETTTIDLEFTLVGSGSVRVQIEERFYQLPDLAEVEIAPRPTWMMPSPTFVTDSSLVRTNFVLP